MKKTITACRTASPKEQAMAAEQALISTYTLNYLVNARREIAVRNLGKFQDYIGSIAAIFEGVAEDELMNLMMR